MAYNNGFPTSTTYQTVPSVGYTQPYQSNMQNLNNQLNTQQINSQQMQMPMQPVFNQITDERIMVNGIENAKLYPIAPNRTETLWDIDGKTFYRINAGVAPRIFRYEEITTPIQNEAIPSMVNNTINNNDINNNHTHHSEQIDMSNYVQFNDLENLLNRLVDEKLKEKEVDNSVDNVSTNTSVTATSTPKKSMSKTR